MTKVCESLGMEFPPWQEFDPREGGRHVVIGPPRSPGGSFLGKIAAPRTAVITGWALDTGAKYRNQCDAVFPLSDHADFPDLLRFVDLVQPRRVYTVHGFAVEFAQTLRARGIEAWALGGENQMEMTLPG